MHTETPVPPFPPPPESVRVRASDGVELHVARYAADSPRAVVVAAHGVQSHAGWFDRSSRQMADAGLEVWFADRRGSGRSGGDRGHVRGGERLLRDLDSVLAETPSGVPKLLLGVCWGGKLMAAAAAAGRDVDGVGLLYPGLFPRVGSNPWNWLLLKGAKFIGVQRRPTRLPLSPELFTDDPAWQAAIRSDPLALTEVSVGLVQSGLDLDRVRSPAGVSMPVFCGIAGRDRVIRNRPLRRWLEGVKPPVEVVEYPDARHVLEFEASRERSTADFIAWAGRVLSR